MDIDFSWCAGAAFRRAIISNQALSNQEELSWRRVLFCFRFKSQKNAGTNTLHSARSFGVLREAQVKTKKCDQLRLICDQNELSKCNQAKIFLRFVFVLEKTIKNNSNQTNKVKMPVSDGD